MARKTESRFTKQHTGWRRKRRSESVTCLEKLVLNNQRKKTRKTTQEKRQSEWAK